MSVDLVNNLLEQINKVDATRRAFLRYVQLDNQCKCILGSPCHSHKCGCAIEMQACIDMASAPSPTESHMILLFIILLLILAVVVPLAALVGFGILLLYSIAFGWQR